MRFKRSLAMFAGITVWLAGIGSVSVSAVAEGSIPPYELVRFSQFEKEYSNAAGNLLYGDTLYADWMRADNTENNAGIDVATAYGDRENLRLKITMDLATSEASLSPDDCWEGMTVKLRSPDVKDKEGDPTLEANGGNSETNSEHNYGWNIRPENVAIRDGHLELSIPLNRPADTQRGLMDWTNVQRILLSVRLKSGVVADGLAQSCSMTLSQVKIVNDIMEITRDQIRQAASDAFPENIVYSEESMAIFLKERDAALALVENDEATLEELQAMAAHMNDVRSGLVEVTFAVADFPRMLGTYPDKDTHTLYADWTYASQGSDTSGVDLSQHDFSKVMLQLELELQGPDEYAGCWNNDGWVLLRSVDEEERICTYGWRLSKDCPAVGRLHTGVNRLSIPLDATQADGYEILKSDPEQSGREGQIDWTAVNRLHLYLEPEGYQKGDFTMKITMARLVDMTLADEAMDALEAALSEAPNDESLYTDASWEALATAKTAAESLKASYPFISPAATEAAEQSLRTALEGLEEKPPYRLGDVDDDGEVTAADALLVLQAATAKLELSDAQALAADVDRRDGVTSADALLILQYTTHKISSF